MSVCLADGDNNSTCSSELDSEADRESNSSSNSDDWEKFCYSPASTSSLDSDWRMSSDNSSDTVDLASGESQVHHYYSSSEETVTYEVHEMNDIELCPYDSSNAMTESDSDNDSGHEH